MSGTTSDITENFDGAATIQPANVLRHSIVEHFPNQTSGFSEGSFKSEETEEFFRCQMRYPTLVVKVHVS